MLAYTYIHTHIHTQITYILALLSQLLDLNLHDTVQLKQKTSAGSHQHLGLAKKKHFFPLVHLDALTEPCISPASPKCFAFFQLPSVLSLVCHGANTINSV